MKDDIKEIKALLKELFTLIFIGLIKLSKMVIKTIIITKIIAYCLAINTIDIPYLPFL